MPLRFLALRLMSKSCFLEPRKNEFTLPMAHAAIETPGREPEPRYAPSPRLYTCFNSPNVNLLLAALDLKFLSMLLFPLAKFHSPID
jgi:hypothetical protein